MGEEATWIDISQPLDHTIATWPNDTPFSYERAVTKKRSGSVNIGKITMSLHTGTHVDAPVHFDNGGRGILDLDINVFIGKARLIDVTHCKQHIDTQAFAAADTETLPPRVLLRTSLSNERERFPACIPSIDATIAPFLKEKGVRLIGVDVPSVDPLDSKTLPAHHALFEHGIHILENVMLDGLAPGDYEFVAMPLPLADADGSPVRAAVRPLYGKEEHDAGKES
ncbi:arylformamidase [Salicibibacter cibarius]|uniref:Kynurenine formamidase n=1 Tax=Salicibibacter cibarius TaxID=2743000 RepID=A0A7T6YZY6_9BACI|nr:arylformamidase [Salicibibacter cibarius]QQK74428.1 arylformamidase [Salicibibacter cibarius]